MTNQSTVP
jgi:hypothetical protein